jgi:hypothetical protein
VIPVIDERTPREECDIADIAAAIVEPEVMTSSMRRISRSRPDLTALVISSECNPFSNRRSSTAKESARFSIRSRMVNSLWSLIARFHLRMGRRTA